MTEDVEKVKVDKSLLPNKKAFKLVCEKMADGEELILEDVGKVFGIQFYRMLVYLLLDASDAARAIQFSIDRVGGKE